MIIWPLTSSDLYGYATAKTIHHYVLWTAPSGQTTLTLQKQLQPSVTQFDLSTLGLSGSYDVYMEMVGQPSTQNEVLPTLAYQH